MPAPLVALGVETPGAADGCDGPRAPRHRHRGQGGAAARPRRRGRGRDRDRRRGALRAGLDAAPRARRPARRGGSSRDRSAIDCWSASRACRTAPRSRGCAGSSSRWSAARCRAAPAGSFYHFELLGCACHDARAGRARGGAGAARGRRRRAARDRPRPSVELLVPFVDAFVVRIDVAGAPDRSRPAAWSGGRMRVDVITIFPELFEPFLPHQPGRPRGRGGAARDRGARPARSCSADLTARSTTSPTAAAAAW